MADDAGEVTVLFCDICDFNEVVNECQDAVTDILDEVFRAFDIFCQQEGVQKIETVGKTYMACGGLKFLEGRLARDLKQKKPVLRVIEVAKKMMRFIKEFQYRPRKNLKIKIGIHHGNCILGLLGFHKPQFSLIGDTINTTSRHCTTGQKGTIILSQNAFSQIPAQEVNARVRYWLTPKSKKRFG